MVVGRESRLRVEENREGDGEVATCAKVDARIGVSSSGGTNTHSSHCYVDDL